MAWITLVFAIITLLGIGGTVWASVRPSNDEGAAFVFLAVVLYGGVSTLVSALAWGASSLGVPVWLAYTLAVGGLAYFTWAFNQ